MYLLLLLLAAMFTLSYDSVFGQSDIFELSSLGHEIEYLPETSQSADPFGPSHWTADDFEGVRIAPAGGTNGSSGAYGGPAAGSFQPQSNGSSEPASSGPPFGVETVGNFFSVNTFTFAHPLLSGEAEFLLPGRANVAENNLALPQDRFYFLSNQFNNALNRSIAGIGAAGENPRDESIGRYTAVAERTFFDKWMSVELRLPTYGSADVVDAGFAANSLGLGNLRVITKFALYRSQFLAFAAGLGLTAPTGEDAQFSVADQVYTVNNQAVHLLPYVAYLFNPNERFFYQGFFQLDTPANGNAISFRDISSPDVTRLGKLNDQSVGYVDLSIGYWLYRNHASPSITRMATLFEWHYAASLQDTDRVHADIWDAYGHSTVEFGNARNRFNVVHVTFGLHTEIRNRIAVRIGGVLPLTSGDDRFFDSEIHSSVIYRY